LLQISDTHVWCALHAGEGVGSGEADEHHGRFLSFQNENL
jgi:hypothetical protein